MISGSFVFLSFVERLPEYESTIVAHCRDRLLNRVVSQLLTFVGFVIIFRLSRFQDNASTHTRARAQRRAEHFYPILLIMGSWALLESAPCRVRFCVLLHINNTRSCTSSSQPATRARLNHNNRRYLLQASFCCHSGTVCTGDGHTDRAFRQQAHVQSENVRTQAMSSG